MPWKIRHVWPRHNTNNTTVGGKPRGGGSHASCLYLGSRPTRNEQDTSNPPRPSVDRPIIKTAEYLLYQYNIAQPSFAVNISNASASLQPTDFLVPGIHLRPDVLTPTSRFADPSQRQAPVYHAFHFIYRVSFFSHFVSCLNMTQSVDPAVSSGARKTYGSFNAAISWSIIRQQILLHMT